MCSIPSRSALALVFLGMAAACEATKSLDPQEYGAVSGGHQGCAHVAPVRRHDGRRKL
jgi:hypothetical protein